MRTTDFKLRAVLTDWFLWCLLCVFCCTNLTLVTNGVCKWVRTYAYVLYVHKLMLFSAFFLRQIHVYFVTNVVPCETNDAILCKLELLRLLYSINTYEQTLTSMHLRSLYRNEIPLCIDTVCNVCFQVSSMDCTCGNNVLVACRARFNCVTSYKHYMSRPIPNTIDGSRQNNLNLYC